MPHSKKRSHEEFSRNSFERPRKTSKSDHAPSWTRETSIAALDAKYPSTEPYPTIPSSPQAAPGAVEIASSSYPPPLPRLSHRLTSAPFRHASLSDHRRGQLNYERLEFLGDAYLEIIATRLIYSRLPQLTVGRQSSLRQTLVRNSTLAKFARLYNFEKRVESIDNNMTSSKQEKILADVMEAYVAAVVLTGDEAAANAETEVEGGFQVAEAWLTALWVPVLLEENLDLYVVTNRKEELSRMIGGKFVKLEYLEEKPMEISREKSETLFTIGVFLTGWNYERKRLGVGKGINMKEAGMKAAADALDNNKEFLMELADVKQKHDTARRLKMAAEQEEKEKEKNGQQRMA